TAYGSKEPLVEASGSSRFIPDLGETSPLNPARTLTFPPGLMPAPWAPATQVRGHATSARVTQAGDPRVEPTRPAALDRALAGDADAVRDLVNALMPVVQRRVARTLHRRRARAGTDLRTALEDLVQDTFYALFQERARLLRTWNPERGLTLESFVGLVAE